MLEFDLPVIDRDPAALTRDSVDLVIMRMMVMMIMMMMRRVRNKSNLGVCEQS